MKAVVVGTGYVGLVTGACLADVGVNVICIDVDKIKIDNLKEGILPIYEPGLDEIVERNVKAGRLMFSPSLADNIKDAEVIFIAVGTPPGEDGSADMKYVLSVAKEIGVYLNHYAVVITKSTVPVGSSDLIKRTISAELENRNSTVNFDVASNPEFLKEGAAIKDFMSPDRIVVGVDKDKAKTIIDALYHPFLLNGYRIIYMDIPSAELTKYTANAMLATRISFMNDIANLCEIVGADINQVRAGIGSDPRIGKKFLYAGVGYGGSCFPKDVKALIRIGQDMGQELRLLKAVEDINNDQKHLLFKKISSHFKNNLKGKTIGIWGLAFKPNTDDVREAPSFVLINDLIDAGANVRVFDPVAMDESRKYLNERVFFANDIYDAVLECDGVALVTEWNEFRLPDWLKIKQLMKSHVVFDGRNVYEHRILLNLGFDYYGIGWK